MAARISGSFTASTGTASTSGTTTSGALADDGLPIGYTDSNVAVATAGGALTLVSPTLNGEIVAIEAKPASDNGSATWACAITKTDLGSTVGNIGGASIVNGAALGATGSGLFYPPQPIYVSQETLTFTITALTASKGCRARIYIR